MAPREHSLYPHAEWLGGTNQLNDPRAGDGDAPASQIEAGILGRNIADGSISDQSEVSQALWSGKEQPTIDSAYSDAKPMHSHRRKGLNWHPMQRNAYFLVMEPMGNSDIDYGTRRIGN